MVSSKVIVFVLTVIITAITFVIFAYPVTSFLHFSTTEANLQSFFNFQSAIHDAHRHGIGITQKGFNLQRNYFIVAFRYTEFIDDYTKYPTKIIRSSWSGIMEDVYGSGFVYYKEHITGLDSLSNCGVGDTCLCLINLDYRDPDIITTGRSHFLVRESQNRLVKDISNSFFRDYILVSLNIRDPHNAMEVWGNPITQNPRFQYQIDSISHTKTNTSEYNTDAFVYNFLLPLYNTYDSGWYLLRQFSVFFVNCRPMRDLCTCNVCSLYDNENDCVEEGWDSDREILRGGSFGCNWTTFDEGVEGVKNVCFNQEGYANATSDCTLWVDMASLIEKDLLKEDYLADYNENYNYQFVAISERSSFDMLSFRKRGCAIELFDTQKSVNITVEKTTTNHPIPCPDHEYNKFFIICGSEPGQCSWRTDDNKRSYCQVHNARTK